MKVNDTLNKAYGNIPKEITPCFDIDYWVPGVKYYWLFLVRKFTR